MIQPFMKYPPPDYAFEPGPYEIAIDDIRFYVAANEGDDSLGGWGSDPGRELAPTIEWTGSVPLVSPVSDAEHDIVAVKDPSVVRYGDRWHVYASSVSSEGAYSMNYTSFSDLAEASGAPVYYMDQTPGFDTYTAAPQVFYFTPQNKWYPVFQSGPPMYSTADDVGDPTGWTPRPRGRRRMNAARPHSRGRAALSFLPLRPRGGTCDVVRTPPRLRSHRAPRARACRSMPCSRRDSRSRSR